MIPSPPPIKPFRFFDLPPELRSTIYRLWIPSTLHISLGFPGIRLGYFHEEPHSGQISFQTLNCAQLFYLNRQFHHEFCHVFFSRATWSFSSTNLLVQALGRLPIPTRDRIRHISVRLSGCLVDQSPLFPSDLSNDGTPLVWLARAQRHLRQMKELQSLVIIIQLVAFSGRSHLASSLGYDPAGFWAANIVADFSWEGLETRIPFVQSALPAEFVETLKGRCGQANVSVMLKHHERYAGQMVDVVISQRAVGS